MSHNFIIFLSHINHIFAIYFNHIFIIITAVHNEILNAIFILFSTWFLIIIITSTSNLQPSTAIANQLPGQ